MRTEIIFPVLCSSYDIGNPDLHLVKNIFQESSKITVVVNGYCLYFIKLN